MQFLCGWDCALKLVALSSPMRSSLCLQSCGCNCRIRTSAYQMLWNHADNVHVKSTCDMKGWQKTEAHTQIASVFTCHLIHPLQVKKAKYVTLDSSTIFQFNLPEDIYFRYISNITLHFICYWETNFRPCSCVHIVWTGGEWLRSIQIFLKIRL